MSGAAARTRIAFIGCGRFASTVHYPSLAELPTAELAAVAELDEGLLHATAERYGVPPERRYTDHRKMLDEVECEAVYVIMEPAPAPPIIVDCLRRGRHVFMEKPPGLHAGVTERLAEEADRAGVILQVGWNRRFAPVVRRAADIVRRSGPPTLVMGEFHKAHPAPEPFCGTGSWMVVDQSHALDAISFLAGGLPSSFEARCRRLRGYNDCNAALLSWDTGTTGIFMSNYVSGGRVERFEMHGEDVGAYMEAPRSAVVYRSGEPEPERLDGPTIAGSDAFHRTYGYYQEAEHFVESIRSGGQPETNIGHALGLMRLIARMEAA